MPKENIFIAGASGMVGSSLVKLFSKKNYNLITPSSKNLNLINQKEVITFFRKNRIDYVIIAAARVGGILENSSYPAEFIYHNTLIQSNIIHSAYENNVKKLIFLGSSCIYPKLCPQPIKEEYLLSNYLEPTNEAYALAKISGIKMCKFYNLQYGLDFRALMPTNLYGNNDNFDDKSSHVIPALISRMHNAKLQGAESVTIWGSGSPLREFLHVDDLSSAVYKIFKLTKQEFIAACNGEECHLNVGHFEETTIRKLASLIQEVVGFQGKLVFDSSLPDGTPRKKLDISKLDKLGWRPVVNLRDGISHVYDWYLKTNL